MCTGGRRLARVLAAAVVLAGAVAGGVLAAAPAHAHPLGNFTVNRYARVEVSAGVVRVHYVLDEAEIPAFQSRREVSADRAAFVRRRANAVAAGLRLVIDGVPVALAPVDTRLTEPPGEGGLTTLRLAVTYEAPLPTGAGPGATRRADFADGNEPDRIGWREVVVVARGDARLVSSDAPADDASDELRSYPSGRQSAPLDRRLATFAFAPGSRPVEASPLAVAGLGRDGPRGFAALVDHRDASGFALLGLLALAVGFGAVHALGPGHGKTVMAAYLVGSRGRPRDAVALGAAVSLMHTASVLVLALVLVRVDRSVSADRLYPWMTLASGLVVAGVGGWLLASRWRAARPAAGDHADHAGHDHAGHDHAGHDHAGHDHAGQGAVHAHGFGRAHSHAPPAGPRSRRGLLMLAASGGLFPSPTAVVVLLSAFSLQRAGLGLALVGAFSVGLAVTLTLVGLALVLGSGVAERRGPRRLVRALPLLGAAGLLVAGLVLVGRGAGQLG